MKLPCWVAALPLCFSAAGGAMPVAPGTGMPWLNERPSSGVAVWNGSPEAGISTRGLLRLCVIRVEFVEDFDPSTTGNGSFDPSHGIPYTEALAGQMSDYVLDVSGGRLELVPEVFPSEGAYAMGHQMSWYGGEAVEWTGLCVLLRDAVQAADPDVDFSQFDAVMVVHAGAGQESDIFGDSPGDLYSVFLGLADLAYYLPEGGPGYPGIETGDGVYVQEGMLLPETETQDGFGLGVLGTMVHELMHQFGLPDLYDTETGAVGVGGWDIMGYGQWMMSGFWPPAPGAWSRSYLGWATEITVPSDTLLECAAGDTICRVRLSGSEYLLVENRLRDPDGDGLCGADEHDFGLRGSGILIWHVDQGEVNERLASNTMNTDPEHKAVDLEEADGIQDFDYSLPDIYGIEGSEYDPWFSGGYGSVFGPGTEPNSSTSWGGATGITIEVLDTPQAAMDVSFDFSLMPDGWPVSLGPLDFGPVPRETGSGTAAVFTSTVGILWQVLPEDPVPQAIATGVVIPPLSAELPERGACMLWCDSDSAHLVDASGSSLPGWPVALPAPPVAAMLSPRLEAVAIATKRDRIHLFDLSGVQLPGWPREVPEAVAGLAVLPVENAPAVAASTVSGRVHAWDRGGMPLQGWSVEAQGGEPVSPPLCCDFDRDGIAELAVLCGSTLSLFDERGLPRPGFPVVFGAEPLCSPWLADMNADGHPEILAETTEGVEAFEGSGAVLMDWPLEMEGDPGIRERSAYDSGSGTTGSTAFGTRDGRIFLCGPAGAPEQGFPLSTGDYPLGRPLVSDLDGDGLLEICAADASGWTGLWETGLGDRSWYPGADYSGENCWWSDLLAPGQGGGLLVPGSFFVYPNPVRGDGPGTIRFESGEDAAWRIDVFNLAGELVTRMSGSCQAGMAFETEWQTRDLSPGVYYVCLELDGASSSVSALFHAGVVH
ncbi:hypothetical protein GX411_01055 [Candidatus Fermentibacteria bacterium]|nr:hypothetical protein [Candidatus Fermentibacteria bacterium]